MNADFSVSFEPYKLREFYKPFETPQVVVEDDTVFCKHGHPSAENIEEKIRSEGCILSTAKNMRLFAAVQVEMEYLQKLLEKNKDQRATFALSKLVRQEQSLLYLVTAIYNARVSAPANKNLSEKMDSEKHASYPEKEKNDEELSVFKSRTRFSLKSDDFFKIEIDSSSNPRNLCIFSFFSRKKLPSKFSDYCTVYSALKGEIKTLESLQNSESFYAQLNCQSEEEREGIELGITISRKWQECRIAHLEKCKATFLARIAQPLNQTPVANQQSQVASLQLPGPTIPQLPPTQNGPQVPPNPVPVTPQPPRPPSPPKTLPMQTDGPLPLVRMTNQKLKMNDLQARVCISQFIAHIANTGLCALPIIAKFGQDLQKLLNESNGEKELGLEENLKRIINSIPYDNFAEFNIQYFMEILFAQSKERVSNFAPTRSRRKKRKADAVSQPKPQPVMNKKASQTKTSEFTPKKRKPNPEPKAPFNDDDAAQLLAKFGNDKDN